MASVDSKMMRKYCELMERNLKEVMDPGVFEWLVGCSVYDSTPAFHLKDLTVVIPVASFADADISSWVVREMPLDEKRQPRIWIPPMDWELSVTKRMRTRVRSIFTQPDNTDASKINDLTFEIVIRIVRELGAKDTSSFYGATRLLYAFYSLQGSGEYGRVERLRGLKAAHRVTEHKVPGGIPYDDVRRQLEAHQLIGPRNRKFLHKTLEVCANVLLDLTQSVYSPKPAGRFIVQQTWLG